MHDVVVVGRLEGLGNLPRQGERLTERQPGRPSQSLLECFPFDDFEDERLHAFGPLDPVDRRDVRVIERGQHAGFALEAREPVRIVRKDGREDLDRHVAAEH